MAQTGFLTRTIARLRTALDEPTVNAKYSNADLIAYIESSYAHVLGEVNRNKQVPLMGYFDVTLGDPSDDQYFQLPPTVAMVLVIEVLDASGNLLGFAEPKGLLYPYGRSYSLSGTQLHVYRNRYASTSTLRFWYAPSGTAHLHDGTLEAVAAGTVTLAATPTTGTLDMRPSAYVGCALRILSADTNDVVQDRVISVYNPVTRVATLQTDLSPLPTGTVTYEIAPVFDQTLDMVIASYTAWFLLGLEGQYKRQQVVEKLYRQQIRDARLNAATYDSYVGMYFDSETAFQLRTGL